MGHTAQEGKGRRVAVQKGLGGLRWIRLHKAAVAVGQVQHEVVHLALVAANDHQGLAEVALGVARRMGQRHEHLRGHPKLYPEAENRPFSGNLTRSRNPRTVRCIAIPGGNIGARHT